jgi:hypothetical protein
MADFPSYAKIQFDGYSESFDPSVERTEMERGGPKESVLNSQVLMKLKVSIRFYSKADADSFETWYFDTIKRVGTFNLTHPRTGATVVANFEGGNIGELYPLAEGFRISQRDCVIEYLR